MVSLLSLFFFLPCAVWLKWEPEPVFPLYEEVFLAYKEKCTPGYDIWSYNIVYDVLEKFIMFTY